MKLHRSLFFSTFLQLKGYIHILLSNFHILKFYLECSCSSSALKLHSLLEPNNLVIATTFS